MFLTLKMGHTVGPNSMSQAEVIENIALDRVDWMVWVSLFRSYVTRTVTVGLFLLGLPSFGLLSWRPSVLGRKFWGMQKTFGLICESIFH